MNSSNNLNFDLTAICINAFFKVYNIGVHGFLEKVNLTALVRELKKAGLKAMREATIDVYYEKSKTGLYVSDIMANRKVIIEVKAAEALNPAHEAPLINYLKASEIEVGLLFNFGKKPERIRRVLTAAYKKHNKS